MAKAAGTIAAGCIIDSGDGRMRASAHLQHSGLVLPGMAGLHGCRHCAGNAGELGSDTVQDGGWPGMARIGLSMPGCFFFVYALAGFF